MSTEHSQPDDPSLDLQVVYAVRDALPTRRHAEMLFEMVTDHLGEEVWIESVNEGASRTLFRRESPGSPWIVPWPVLKMTRGGREGPGRIMTSTPGVYRELPRRPGPAPKLRDLGPGQIEIFDGPSSIAIAYGKDGRWFETCRTGAEELAGVIPALEARSASPVEIVASFLADLDAGRHGRGRARFPVALPIGVEGAWYQGLRAFREAAFRSGDAPESGWMAADGWTRTVKAFGPTREETTRAWKEEVDRVRPFPERPKPLPENLPEPYLEQEVTEHGIHFHGVIRGPMSDVPWVEPTVENAPAVVMPLGAPPAAPPRFGVWCRLVGRFGEVIPAAVRWEPEGFTLIGDQILDRLALDRLEEQLEEADRKGPPMVPSSRLPGFDASRIGGTLLRVYRIVDERTGELIEPSVACQANNDGFHPADLHGEQLRRSVLRMRPVLLE